ncbi:MAG: phosphatase domain-containing putative toxin [Ramlibacter sp.]
MNAPAVLELRGFGVAYGTRTVLDAIDLDVPASGCTVLLGPSGTGKSTLLRTIAGHNTANPQVRTWGSSRYAQAPCEPGHRPALVAQNSRLLVSNVLENLVFHLPGRSALTRRMQIDAVVPLVEQCGQQWLLDALHSPVVERPLAQQRVIAILREAIAAPALLMVDEPTAGLAAQEAHAIVDLLAVLSGSRALLVVLHNLREARQLANHVVLVAGGRLQEAGEPRSFFERPASESGRLFLATGSCPEPARIAPPRVATFNAAPSAACGPRGFAWLLPGRLAGTPWPGLIHDIDYDLQLLADVGVTQLVCLTEERFDPGWAAPHGIGCRSSPMPDMHAPGLAQAVALCRELDALLQRGEVVAVHCRAGLGRTGTVLAAYWLWRGGGRLDALRALEDVRRMEAGWVQSSVQVRFLEDFAQRLATGEIETTGDAT